MTSDTKSPGAPGTRSDAPAKAPGTRQERLNAALRANLKKRKAQARQRAEQAGNVPPGPEKDTDSA